MQQAARAAQQLSNYLTQATDDTGRFDLSKFNNALKQGGVSLEEYANQLQAIGPAGEKAFLQVASAISKAELPIMRTSKLLDGLWTTMKNTVRWQLTSSALHGFMGAVSTAYGYTKDLNASLNSIQIVTEKNNSSMEQFAENANKAAKALSTTTTDYTDASLIYYQQGLSDQEVEGRTNTTIKLANVAGESAEKASEQLTAIWNNFYDGSKSLEYYADVMTALGASTASSTQEISAGLQKFAAIADTVGLSYEYAASALATITATTRESADIVGTSLRTLFARIQGLQQDETQDDGTTLNKYSKALAQVGIDIKDTSGELKSMNEILDEMGARWGTLSTQQQMALAQTVAGVRQYTQLIALMNEWDFFQENLATAMGSEGTLEKQAQIYANSWEAARDRVRAAAEDIYDSINIEDFVISMDDALVPVLSGIADTIDALGGLKGILIATGYAMTTLYSDKISQGIRDIAYNITLLSGKELEHQRAIKQTVAALAEEMALNSASLNERNINDTDIQARKVALQVQLNEKAKDLSTIQYEQLQNEIALTEAIGQAAVAYGEKAQQAEKASDSIASDILLSDRATLTLAKNTAKSVHRQLKEEWNKLTSDPQNAPIQLKDLMNFTSKDTKYLNLDNLLSGFRQLNKYQGTISSITKQLEGLKDKFSETNPKVKELADEFQQLTGRSLDTSSLEAALKQLAQETNMTTEGAELLKTVLSNFNVPTTVLDQLAASCRAAGDAESQAKNATDLYKESLQNLTNAITNAQNNISGWSDLIVSGARNLASLGMAIQAVQNLGSIWKNDDLTQGEKIVQTMTSLGMIIPSLVQVYKDLTKTILSNTLASLENKKIQDISNGKKLLLRILGITLEEEAQTGAVIANTVAWYANPMFLAAGAIVVGIVAIANALNDSSEELRNNTKAMKESAEASHSQIQANGQQRDSISELYKEYIVLQSQLDGTSQSKQALADKTEELLAALGEEGLVVDSLSGSYDKLNKKIAQRNIKDIKNELSDLKTDIERQQNAIKAQWDTGISSNYDYSLRPDSGLQVFDEYNFNADFISFMRERLGDNKNIKLSDENIGTLSFEFNQESYKEAMAALGDFITYAQDASNNVRTSGSEHWKSLQEQYSNIIKYDENINESRKQQIALIQELAQNEAAELGVDLANVDTLDEYNEYVKIYKEKLKSDFNEYNIQLDDVEDIDAYFDSLAKKYLSGYSHVKDEIIRSSALEEIIDTIGEKNRDIAKKFFENDKYDIIALASIDWEAIDKDGESLEEEIQQKYEAEKAKLDLAKFEVQLPVVTDIVTDLSSGKDLDKDQLQLLKELEQEYGVLQGIRDKTSAQYIQALRDIREGMEHSLSTEAISALNNAWDNLVYTAKDTEKQIGNVQGTYKKLKAELGDDIEASIKLDDGDFVQNMKAILDADYAVQVAIEADLRSDIDDITSFATKVQEATKLIKEGFKVAYTDAEALQAVFPGILAEHTIAADGMIQLNSEIAQSCVELAHTQIENDQEACKQNIKDYQTVLLAKAAAMRQIAEGLAGLQQKTINGEKDTSEEVAKIEEGITNFKSACADEQALISEGLATSEINDAQQVLTENDKAAGNVANNWANAYDSMIQNSKEWAEIAIRNAAAVAKAMKEAREGGNPMSAWSDVARGAIYSKYSGGAEQLEYSNSFESRGETDLSWEDYYKAGDYQKAYEEAIKDAEAYEAAASKLDAWIASIEGATGTVGNLVNTVGTNTKSSSSKNKKSFYDDEDKKILDEILERYHEINREIKNQSELLDDIDNDLDRTYGISKFKNFNKQLKELEKQQENYNKKLAEANGYLEVDKQAVIDKFSNAVFTDDGEIANYTELVRGLVDEYNTFLDSYDEFMTKYAALDTDAKTEEIEAQKHAWEVEKKQRDKQFERNQKVLQQYEDTLDTVQDVNNQLEEINRNIADNKLSQVEYRLTLVIDVKSMRDALRDFDIKAREIFNDALTHGIPVADIRQDQAQAEADMLPEYQKQYADLIELYNSTDNAMDRERIIEDIKDLQGKILDSAEAIVDWVNSIEDIIPDAVDAARERYELFTKQLEHNTTVLDTIKELYTLQGVTYKTMEGFKRLQGVSQEKLDAQLAEAELQKKWYDEARIRLQQAQADLDSLGGDESDIRYDTYKKARDAYLAEFNEAQEAYLSLAKDAMETAQEMYLQQIEKAVYDFGQAVSNGIGLDLLQDKYDHYIEKDERYFDKVNEAYQTTAWFNKLQADIDKATNAQTKERLKALQEEINLRREGNKLSQYDLDILNAKYEVLQAQLALEDAQNAKNNLQLVRDRQGNWNYQYTADPDQIEDAQQDLLDAQNEWYNIAKDQVTEVTGEIIATWQECQDKIKEIYSDMTLTDQERADRAAEIYKYYSDKIKYLEEEKQVAIADMTEAGNASLFTAAVIMGDELTDLTGMTAEDIKRLVEEGGDSIIGLLTADNETIKNVIASNTGLIDLFDNVYAKDLDNMTNNTTKFETILSDTMDKAQDDFTKYGDTVQQVADKTGTSLDQLDQETQEVSESTDILRDSGLDAAQALWEMIDATQQAVYGYLDMAESIWQAVDALRALAEEQADFVASQAGIDEGNSSGQHYYVSDYSAELNRLHNDGEDIFSDNYRWLWEERAQKYAAENWADKGAMDNAALDDLFRRANNGDKEAQQKLLDVLNGKGFFTVAGFDTGGYTGDFNDAKLAFLHQKELVLNPKDTENILSAVEAVRSMKTDLFGDIEKILDGNAVAAMAIMGQRLNTTPVETAHDYIEQTVHIDEVSFPNVTSADGIQEAFISLVNDAAQWARRRKD